LESELGKCSQFCLDLPIGENRMSDTILLVEDSEYYVFFMQRAMRRQVH